jgi:hypothetical protein
MSLWRGGALGRVRRMVLVATLACGSAAGASAMASQSAASAATSVTLYVNPIGTSTTVCTSQGEGACPTIADALHVATSPSYTGDNVTIEVAAAKYVEQDTVSAVSLASLTIAGGGAQTTTVDGDQAGTVFAVDSGDVTISGLTVTDGSTSTGGGGVNVAPDATATLVGDVLSNNVARYGSGVQNEVGGTLTMSDDTVSNDGSSTNNEEQGGGLYNLGTATLTDDTFSDDSVGNQGGGGIFNTGTLGLTDDTLTDDSSSGATGSGGALVNETGTVTMTDDTLSDDTAAGGGGGILQIYGGTTTVGDSILDAAGCDDVDGTVADAGYNVESDDSCGFGTTSVTNSSNIDLAAALAANGSSGPETLAIGPNSSAFQEVPASACTVRTDERGDHRPGIPGQTKCDAGAFEYQGRSPTITSARKAAFHVKEANSFKLTAIGFPLPTLRERGKLPRGVVFHSKRGKGKAMLAGRPKASTKNAVFHLTITATNGVAPKATQHFTLKVKG